MTHSMACCVVLLSLFLSSMSMNFGSSISHDFLPLNVRFSMNYKTVLVDMDPLPKTLFFHQLLPSSSSIHENARLLSMDLVLWLLLLLLMTMITIVQRLKTNTMIVLILQRIQEQQQRVDQEKPSLIETTFHLSHQQQMRMFQHSVVVLMNSSAFFHSFHCLFLQQSILDQRSKLIVKQATLLLQLWQHSNLMRQLVESLCLK
mmetsp:Transcript_1765/g.3153  ORF Transcript_1765/g.3153 Transcript_1765/m.3153 type:complete len:203 (+) Transcript_1765:1755-2363(+)